MSRVTPLVVVDEGDHEPELVVVDADLDKVTLTMPDGHEYTVDRAELAASINLNRAA